METRLLARLIEVARTVNPIAALTSVDATAADRSGGQTMRGQVAAQLADGRFRVLIEGRFHSLKLPPGTRAGDVIELRLPARELAAQRALGTSIPGLARAEVSSAGRLLSALTSADAPPPAQQSEPVVDSPTDEPRQLTGALARAIEKSGLFYESHQARWVAGEYPLERLREEPQANAGGWRRTIAPSDTPQIIETREQAELMPTSSTPTPARARNESAMEPPVRSQMSQLAQEPVAVEVRKEVAAQETLPLIRQQLDTLETRNLSWLGEIWPGQTMRWEISEEADGRPEESEARQWGTRFELCLPMLGNVGATLSLSPLGVRITLCAAVQETIAEMLAARSSLVQALDAAGVPTAAIRVIQEPGHDAERHAG